MLKRDIQKVFKKYIEDLLRKDEIYHLRHKPLQDPDAASLEVSGLDLRLSDYTEALGMYDFEVFEEDAAYFIDEHFQNHSLKPEDVRYRVLVREYVKATAYCIQVSLKRLKGYYFDEPTPYLSHFTTFLLSFQRETTTTHSDDLWSVPWESGSASLFLIEFKRRLCTRN